MADNLLSSGKRPRGDRAPRDETLRGGDFPSSSFSWLSSGFTVPTNPKEMEALRNEIMFSAPLLRGLDFGLPNVASGLGIGAARRGMDYTTYNNSYGFSDEELASRVGAHLAQANGHLVYLSRRIPALIKRGDVYEGLYRQRESLISRLGDSLRQEKEKRKTLIFTQSLSDQLMQSQLEQMNEMRKEIAYLRSDAYRDEVLRDFGVFGPLRECVDPVADVVPGEGVKPAPQVTPASSVLPSPFLFRSPSEAADDNDSEANRSILEEVDSD